MARPSMSALRKLLLAGLVCLLADVTRAVSLGPVHPVSTNLVSTTDLPPSCESDIYCRGELLHTVQMAKLFADSKTFVDLKVKESPEFAKKEFDKLMQRTGGKPSQDEVRAFVNATFEEGDELEEWVPEDWTKRPSILSRIVDDKYREWAFALNGLWLHLGRKIKADVRDRPSYYSQIYVPNGFVIPGGRFKELYYWDTYWIVQGLLTCDMDTTVKGVIENLLHLVRVLGFVPNGSRVYYEERSQPPLLTAMARSYYDKTKDLKFLRDNIELLEKEFNFWMNNSMIEVEKDGKTYQLARYYFLSNGPRPESYSEDYETVSNAVNTTEERERMYWELKTGAGSGWDFSSRWFIDPQGTNRGALKDIKTTHIVPVDLNAFLFGAASSLQYFMTVLGRRPEALGYATIANKLRTAVQAVLWNEEYGSWFDYDLLNKKQREHFYGSNMAPLWTYCYDRDNVASIAAKVVKYIEHTNILSYRGGTPSSLETTGEQWDFPNCWAPLQAFIIQGLERTGQEDAENLAEELARRWLHANYVGYERSSAMYEKYDAENIGSFGGGGEYKVQEGFGWTNGLVFELLAKYSSSQGSGLGAGAKPLGPLGSLGPVGPLGGVGALGSGAGSLGQDVSNSLAQSLAHSVDRVRKGLRSQEGQSHVGDKHQDSGVPGALHAPLLHLDEKDASG